jgi:hypothetical protein
MLLTGKFREQLRSNNMHINSPQKLESFMLDYQNYQVRLQQIQGYDEFIRERLGRKWRGYFVNFMFERISGSAHNRKSIMIEEVTRVFSTLITRVARKPKSPSAKHFLPLFVGCPDFPVYKKEKELLRNMVVNDGLHFNGVLVLPPKSYCRAGSDLHTGGLKRHFNQNQHLYYKDDYPLDRLHATRIKEDTMIDYALKAFKSGKIDSDDILILPRAISEL